MSALREAAQQALDALEVATTPRSEDRQTVLKAQAALREALAQPEPEPVGYMPVYELSRLQNGHDGRLRSAKFGASALDGDVAVYVAPPQRKPLTDEEILSLLQKLDPQTRRLSEGVRAFARAIERAHGIGGGE